MSGFARVTAGGGEAPGGDSLGISAGANVEREREQQRRG